MFKKESSEFGKHYSLGKIDEICKSHDNSARNVWIRYKNLNENSSRRVQRDVKTIYKILGIKDTSLHESLDQAWKISDQARQEFDFQKEVIPPFVEDVPVPDVNKQVDSTDCEEDQNEKPRRQDVPKKKRRTELELLQDWSVKLSCMMKSSDRSSYCAFYHHGNDKKTDSMDWSNAYFDEEDAKRQGEEATEVEIIFMD